jgi:PIN domain nuclease of toxin-antitoxin system
MLWALDDPGRLSVPTRSALEDPENLVVVSAASIWESAIKIAAGRLRAPRDLLEKVKTTGFSLLPISAEHGPVAGFLPRHHADPFDRMLVAQAQIEGLTIVTRDPRIRLYNVAVLDA